MLIMLKNGDAINLKNVQAVTLSPGYDHAETTGLLPTVSIDTKLSGNERRVHTVRFQTADEAARYRDELIGQVNAAQADSSSHDREIMERANVAAFIDFQQAMLLRFAVFMDSMIAKVVNEKGPTS